MLAVNPVNPTSDRNTNDRDAKDGDIFEAHVDDLTAFARSLVGPDEAADVVSAATVAVLSSAGWASVRKPRAYLFTAVWHESLRVLRRRKQRGVVERRAQDWRDIELPALHPEVAAAVRELSPQQRAVIVLTYWQDLPVAGVAEHLGISDGSVRRHLARARANLRKVLQ